MTNTVCQLNTSTFFQNFQKIQGETIGLKYLIKNGIKFVNLNFFKRQHLDGHGKLTFFVCIKLLFKTATRSSYYCGIKGGAETSFGFCSSSAKNYGNGITETELGQSPKELHS